MTQYDGEGAKLKSSLAKIRHDEAVKRRAARKKAKTSKPPHRCEWRDDGTGGIYCKKCGRRLRLVSLDEIETGIVSPPPLQ